MNINAELLLSIVVNACAIAYFAGAQSQAQKNLKEQFENLQAHFQEKLTSLEKKQDKHNNLIERVYHTEKQISVIMEKIKVENHRIDDLEKERG